MPSGGPVIASSAGQPLAPAGQVKLPAKFARALIEERRDGLRALLARGITHRGKLAKTLGVSEETIRRDLKAIRDEEKGRLTKEAGPVHVSDLLQQLEQVIVDCSADYAGLKDNTPRSQHVRATIQQTKLRAITIKTALLQQTGVIPADVTNIDKILDAQKAEFRVKDEYNPKLAKVLKEADSRRKVLSVAEKLQSLSPDMAAQVLEALDADEEKPPNASLPEEKPPEPTKEAP